MKEVNAIKANNSQLQESAEVFYSGSTVKVIIYVIYICKFYSIDSER